MEERRREHRAYVAWLALLLRLPSLTVLLSLMTLLFRLTLAFLLRASHQRFSAETVRRSRQRREY